MATARRIIRVGAAVLLAMEVTCGLVACQQPKSTKRDTMIFETIVVGPLGVNCFILGDPAPRRNLPPPPRPGGQSIPVVHVSSHASFPPGLCYDPVNQKW